MTTSLPADLVAMDSPGRIDTAASGSGPLWRISDAPVGYEAALAGMEDQVTGMGRGTHGELIWLLEHPALYTAGTSADPADLVSPDRFPVYRTGRGGQYTYHGPGQRVGYVMLDLKRRGRMDVRRYVHDLEAWIIAALDTFGVKGERRAGRVGIWVDCGGGREDKIAAIGVRVRRWITFHGISLNVDPALDHFDGIVPCGIRGHGVTSLADLGLPVMMPDVDLALQAAWPAIFT